jgi:hypothetical protein
VPEIQILRLYILYSQSHVSEDVRLKFGHDTLCGDLEFVVMVPDPGLS